MALSPTHRFRQLLTDLDQQDAAQGLVMTVSPTPSVVPLTRTSSWGQGLLTALSTGLLGVYAVVLLVSALGYGLMLAGTCGLLMGEAFLQRVQRRLASRFRHA